MGRLPLRSPQVGGTVDVNFDTNTTFCITETALLQLTVDHLHNTTELPFLVYLVQAHS